MENQRMGEIKRRGLQRPPKSLQPPPRPGDQFTRFQEGILRRSAFAHFNGDASCFLGDTKGGRVREAWQRRLPERPREI